MIGWLWRVIVGRFRSCHHHWQPVQHIRVTNADGDTVGHEYVRECTHCGVMRRWKFQ